MLNRIISDIYHLRRVHSILPDSVLGDILKNKLLRLSLQPSLQQLKYEQQQQQEPYPSSSPLASTGFSASPATTSATLFVGSAHSTRNTVGASTNRAAGAVASPFSSPYAIDPGALCNLLDSLAYFHLGSSAVAKEAVQLVQLSVPTMSTPQLCTTLAACCALGAQQDITATALPLLNTALSYYSTSASPNAGNNVKAKGSSSDESQSLLFSQGANVVLLMDALQRAGVREKEVWHLLAEHCLRNLESFDGRQLCSVVTALCTEGVDDYPDFFVAAERHIMSQPSNYLSPDLLQQVVQCYKELHQPVVSLLGVVNATPQHEKNLDRTISAAVTVAAMSGAPHSNIIGGTGTNAAALSSGRRCSTSSRGTASNGTPSASVQHSLGLFESAAISALETADAQGVLGLLRKCERRRIMTPRVMDVVLQRLLRLHYPDLDTVAAATEGEEGKAQDAGKAAAKTSTTTASREHLPVELHQLTQCLLIALEFNNATLFTPSEESKRTLAQSAQESGSSEGRGFAHETLMAVTKDVPLITVLLNCIGRELDHWYHPCLLQIVPFVVRLLPPTAHPQVFFTALVAHLRRSSDLSSHERAAPLRFLIEALLLLRPYGGEATLVEYMPAMTVAVLNAPRTAQLELAAMVAHLPCTTKELVPGIYRQWGSQKRWLRTITESEVESALQIMSRSGERDSQLLHAVVEFIQSRRDQLPPQHVVEYLHQLARLGVRDLELFTHTAEHLMRRAVESTPSSRQWLGSKGSDGVSSSSSPQTAPAVTKQQQWQTTSVHDLTLLLYTFTFVLRDSIRVTQQIIARLKMCSSAATPRDISLALYSFVKLRVVRNEEVTRQLCERATGTVADFTAAELASVWSSLRCLRYPHAKLHQRTLELLDVPVLKTGEVEDIIEVEARAPSSVRPTWRFSDADCLSLGSALLLTETAPLNLNHPLALKRDAPSNLNNGSRSSNSDGVLLSAFSLTPSVCITSREPLPPTFERHYVDVCRRLLPSATGQRLYLILGSLSQCRSTALHISLNVWETTLTLVDTHAESLTTGRVGDAAGIAQLEVLAALRILHQRVADVDALSAADAVRGESSNWPTPYCPPGLWAVLRPRWRELTRSTAVQMHPSFMAVVNDVKCRGGEAQTVVVEPTKGRTPPKPRAKRMRKV